MAILDDLIMKVEDPVLRDRLETEVRKITKQKKFGLVFEEHLPECTPLYDVPIKKGSCVALQDTEITETFLVRAIENGVASCVSLITKKEENIDVNDLVVVAEFGEPIYPYLQMIDAVCNAPDSDLWHTLIEADNYHALQLLEYMYAGKVDCIYIDPPYNKEDSKDWKYNCNYVDGNDMYRHSKWLSMMERRLKLAKKLLNPKDSVLIVTIDELEYLHLGLLLEQMFPEAKMQMISSAINSKGIARGAEFFRVNEYIYVLRFGTSGVTPIQLSPEWKGNIKNTTTDSVRWGSLMRSGTNSERRRSPGCFYPIYVTKDKKHFCGAGDPLDPEEKPEDVKVPDGQIAVFPIHEDGSEGVWQYSKNRFLDIQKKGYARISTQTKRGITIRYISEGWQKRVESGEIPVLGKAEDGSLIFDNDAFEGKAFIPNNQWWIPSHNATEFGSKLIKKIIGDRFTFPKSLYAVHDILRFFVKDKPNALIVDFFAGSGTTLHAVNLLNAEDGGNRRCIMVTNNEIGEKAEKRMKAAGYKPGDPEWEEIGIARYATWPRTVCSIEGHDINGKPLKGSYLGSDKPMAEGFEANAIYFKLGFLDKNAVALGRQFKELLGVLWMKAGAVGPCPHFANNATVPDMMILPENKMAILINEASYSEFRSKVNDSEEIKTVYIVTDSNEGFREMAMELKVKEKYQLYRDYLDNFRINTERK